MILLEANDFIRYENQAMVLDLRPLNTYNRGHLPFAIHVPIYPNHWKSYQKRVRSGTSLPPKLEQLASYLAQLCHKRSPAVNKVHIYDNQGDIISRMVADLLQRKGFSPLLLNGGYQAWRKTQSSIFQKPHDLRLLGGYAGSQKTEILHLLQAKGHQVIDLEGMANHRGSAFGGIGHDAQPSYDTFNNTLAYLLGQMNPEAPIWLENEAQIIGKVGIHPVFWEAMKQAPVIKLEVPRAQRLDHLTEEYGTYPPDQLQAAIYQLNRLPKSLKTQALAAAKAGKSRKMIDLLLPYYDTAYDFLLEGHERVYGLDVGGLDLEGVGELVLAISS